MTPIRTTASSIAWSRRPWSIALILPTLLLIPEDVIAEGVRRSGGLGANEAPWGRWFDGVRLCPRPRRHHRLATARRRLARPELTAEDLAALVGEAASRAAHGRVPGAGAQRRPRFRDHRHGRRTGPRGGRDGRAGVVVTQGTDTLEETAFQLDLMLDVRQPVVVTGALRNPALPGADGAANLLAAIRVAADPAATGLGVVVVMNDEVHAARLVSKTHTHKPSAFASPAAGPLGWIAEDRVRIVLRPARTGADRELARRGARRAAGDAGVFDPGSGSRGVPRASAGGNGDRRLRRRPRARPGRSRRSANWRRSCRSCWLRASAPARCSAPLMAIPDRRAISSAAAASPPVISTP